MKIQTINATFQPNKIGHRHGLQITYLKDNSTRNIFVYHEDGKVKNHLSQFIFQMSILYFEERDLKRSSGSLIDLIGRVFFYKAICNNLFYLLTPTTGHVKKLHVN